MNKYVCDAITTISSCPALYCDSNCPMCDPNNPSEVCKKCDPECPRRTVLSNISEMRGNLDRWKITSFYTGLETQSAKASEADPVNKPGPKKGEVEMGLQYSNLRVTANKGITYKTCDEVARGPTIVVSPPTGLCTQGSEPSKTELNKTLEWSCNCGEKIG